ncbi:MAG: type IV pilus modification PilV family protein [Candidatus Omnitrophota bacterium]
MKLSNRGMNLLELIITVTVLIITLSGIILLFVTGSLLSESSRNLTIAISHAQIVMEDIADTPFSQVKIKINLGWWDRSAPIIGFPGLPILNNESIDTQLISGTDLLDVKVIVTWRNRNGRQASTSLETLFGDL